MDTIQEPQGDMILLHLNVRKTCASKHSIPVPPVFSLLGAFEGGISVSGVGRFTLLRDLDSGHFSVKITIYMILAGYSAGPFFLFLSKDGK